MDHGYIPGIPNPISRLVQGTTMITTRDYDQGAALLDAVVEQGCTCFDTAHVYGTGDNERAFGRWLRERGLRDRLVIIGKGAHHSQDRRRVTPFDISADIHDSLARMQIEAIDLYLLHRDDPDVPVGPIVEALHAHRAAGRIRAYGASNWSHQRIAEANAYAAARGLAPFVASSPQFSLADQIRPPWAGCISVSGPGRQAARDYYASVGMPLFTWSSLAGGFFSGRLRREHLDDPESLAPPDRLALSSYGSPENFTRLERAQQLADQQGLSLAQIALAYVLSQPLPIFAIVGCQSPAEFAENRAAAGLRLSRAECEWLDLAGA